MKQIITCFFIGLFLVCSVNKSISQEMDEAAMMKAWQNFMTPGDMHAMLAKLNGTWEADVKSWMDPSAPPSMSKATNVVTSLFNGLYQTSHLTGDMMGMPFEGRGTTAYDNAKKIFINTWIDNLGSGIIYMTGHWDAPTNTLHFSGMQTDPMKGTDAPIRQEMKIVDDNTHVLTMYGPGMDGTEMKFMEATFKRKK